MVQNDKSLLLRLQERDVEFVIIGEVCMAMHGVNSVTLGIEVCCRLTTENLRRLEAALKGLHPFHRLAANNLPLELTNELCGRLKNLYLKTDIGILDCLGEIKGVGDYESASKHSVTYKLSYGEFRMLDLDTLIAAKEAVGRERDLAAARQLRAIKEKIGQGRS